METSHQQNGQGPSRPYIINVAGQGVSTHIDMLIAFRILQGFAAGFSVAVMQTLIVTNAGKDQATRAITAIGLPAVIAPAIAPLLGGLLVDAIGWRAILLINVPIGIAAIALAAHYLERTPADPAAQLDRMGYLLLAPGLLAAVYGFTTIGHMNSWTSIILLAAGAGLIGYFVLHALRAPSPLIDVRLFTHASFSSAWATLAIASTVFYGGLFLIPLHYQSSYAYTALHAGLLLALQSVGAYFSRSASEKFIARWGTRKTVYMCIAAAIIGTLPFAFPTGQAAGWLILQGCGLFVRGGGIGALTVLTMSATYHGLSKGEVVHASAAGRIATQLGSALGVSVCTVLMTLTHGIGWTTFAYFTVFTTLMAATAPGSRPGPWSGNKRLCSRHFVLPRFLFRNSLLLPGRRGVCPSQQPWQKK
nr:MFS transporter [Corynebacterium sp. ACRPR]